MTIFFSVMSFSLSSSLLFPFQLISFLVFVMCRCQSRASLGCCYNLYSRCYSRPVKQKLALTQSETTTCPVEQQDQKIMNTFFTVLHRSDQAKTRYNLFRGFLCRPLGSITRDAIRYLHQFQQSDISIFLMPRESLIDSSTRTVIDSSEFRLRGEKGEVLENQVTC